MNLNKLANKINGLSNAQLAQLRALVEPDISSSHIRSLSTSDILNSARIAQEVLREDYEIPVPLAILAEDIAVGGATQVAERLSIESIYTSGIMNETGPSIVIRLKPAGVTMYATINTWWVGRKANV